MSNFVPAPDNPDGRIFASYPMPAKLDLLNERPRRESLLEQQLEHKIGEQLIVPSIEVSGSRSPTPDTRHYVSQQYSTGPGGQSITREYKTITTTTTNINNNTYDEPYIEPTRIDNNKQFSANTNQQQSMVRQPTTSNQYYTNQRSSPQISSNNFVTSTTTTANQATGVKPVNNAAILAADLAEKEKNLMAAIESLHSRPYSPFQVPEKIDLTHESRKLQQQTQIVPPSPRNLSRASSSRSASANADLLDKEAKLMQEIEEIEKKPYNPQTMVVEREQWYEYPKGRPNERHLTESRRRVRDFCSLPEHMYPGEDRHIHEEDIPLMSQNRNKSPSMHTTIIRSPKREVDNKSPLPFAFDNFSTKGVRGNIASVGAVEPDRPRPPIYPIIKRTPSPAGLRT